MRDDILIFTDLGYRRMRFKDTFTETSNAGPITVVTSNIWNNGLEYGGGVQTSLTNNIIIRAEYLQVVYNRKTAFSTGNIKPKTNELMVSLVWNVDQSGKA